MNGALESHSSRKQQSATWDGRIGRKLSKEEDGGGVFG